MINQPTFHAEISKAFLKALLALSKQERAELSWFSTEEELQTKKT